MCRLLVTDVGCHVIARLPHVGAVAVGYSLNHPVRNVLGSGVELEHLVQVFVIDVVVNEFLNECEIAH